MNPSSWKWNSSYRNSSSLRIPYPSSVSSPNTRQMHIPRHATTAPPTPLKLRNHGTSNDASYHPYRCNWNPVRGSCPGRKMILFLLFGRLLILSFRPRRRVNRHRWHGGPRVLDDVSIPNNEKRNFCLCCHFSLVKVMVGLS